MYYYPTNKQQEIINLVYQFRFINRVQIQKILNHKDARRINAWLKELVELNYLGRIYSYKLLENTKPAIYYLTGEGIRFIKEKYNFELKDVKKFYQDKKASQKFIDHCITVSEFCVKLMLIQRTSNNDYVFFTKTECYTNELLSKLKPDVYITNTKKVKKNKRTDRFFLDIFDPHVPRYALRYRIKQYIEFYQWELNDSYPTVLLVLPNEQKLKHLMKYTAKQEYDDKNLRFQFTTIDQLLNFDNEKNIWEVVEREG